MAGWGWWQTFWWRGGGSDQEDQHQGWQGWHCSHSLHDTAYDNIRIEDSEITEDSEESSENDGEDTDDPPDAAGGVDVIFEGDNNGKEPFKEILLLTKIKFSRPVKAR